MKNRKEMAVRKRAVELGKTFMLGFSSRKFWNRKDNSKMEYRVHGDDAFVVMTGAENMNMTDVMSLMQYTKLGKDRTREQVEMGMANSMCFGIYSLLDHKQIGFARAVTDYSTCYYVTDVVTDPDYRGKGAANQLMEAVVDCDALRNLRGGLLTKDAMPLYEGVGFSAYPGTFMDRQPVVQAMPEDAGDVAFGDAWAVPAMPAFAAAAADAE